MLLCGRIVRKFVTVLSRRNEQLRLIEGRSRLLVFAYSLAKSIKKRKLATTLATSN